MIIPALNSGWSIDGAIDSVLGQTLSDFEIIVVDDGSDDDTGRHVRRYYDRRLKYLYQERAGRAAARNRGIQFARGRWLAFLDADDVWLSTKLEQQIAALEAFPSSIMAYSKAYVSSNRLLSTQETGRSKVVGSGRPGATDCFAPFLLGELDVRTSTVVARRKEVARLGGFDGRFSVGEDWDLFIRLARGGDVLFIDEPLAIYRTGGLESWVDRARHHNSHTAMRKVVERNLVLFDLRRSDPQLAKYVEAKWEWRCALVEHGLGNVGKATKHALNAVECWPDWLKHDDASRTLMDHLIDLHGEAATQEMLAAEASSLLSSLAPTLVETRHLHRKCLAYAHARRAFRAYRSGEWATGLGHALRAVRMDRTWVRNAGLWSTPVRMSIGRLAQV